MTAPLCSRCRDYKGMQCCYGRPTWHRVRLSNSGASYIRPLRSVLRCHLSAEVDASSPSLVTLCLGQTRGLCFQMEPTSNGSTAAWPSVATSPALLESVSAVLLHPAAWHTAEPLMSRDCLPVLIHSAAQIKEARVLMVGAGGIGCELLKTLVLTGFENITLVRRCQLLSLRPGCCEDWLFLGAASC